jgi:hypothetical protein
MKRATIGFLITAFLVTGCAIGFGRHGEMVIVPALPTTVEVDADQYYYQDGYYYHYNGSVWYYSQRRDGGWAELPRSHYPREVHYNNRREGDHDNRDHDNQRHN